MKRFRLVGSVRIDGTAFDAYQDTQTNTILVIDQSALENAVTIHHTYTGEELDTTDDSLWDDDYFTKPPTQE